MTGRASRKCEKHSNAGDSWNPVDYRLSTPRVNQIEPYAETIEEIGIVMKMLDRELGGPSETSR